jgi:hypothetical protein
MADITATDPQGLVEFEDANEAIYGRCPRGHARGVVRERVAGKGAVSASLWCPVCQQKEE